MVMNGKWEMGNGKWEMHDEIGMPNLKRLIVDNAAYYFVEHVTFEGMAICI